MDTWREAFVIVAVCLLFTTCAIQLNNTDVAASIECVKAGGNWRGYCRKAAP